jgi:uncharacterized protein YuzE
MLPLASARRVTVGDESWEWEEGEREEYWEREGRSENEGLRECIWVEVGELEGEVAGEEGVGEGKEL